MKEQNRMSTQKRILHNILILLAGALIGALFGFFSGFGVFENFSWSSALNVGLLRQLGWVSLLILYPLTFFLIYQTGNIMKPMRKKQMRIRIMNGTVWPLNI